tara:strand:+ start:1212 stop:2003 length:792 start_codon:yes stop_codon:yes gene_type:complete
MAETLTYSEESPDNTGLNADEQESLQIGEKMEQEQSQLLAGKYNSPEALEKAYLELQSKLGSNEEQPKEDEPTPEPEDEPKQESEETPSSNFLDQLWEESQNDSEEYSDELMEKLNSMSKEDLATMYLDQRSNQSDVKKEASDFTDDQVEQLQGLVGGADQYTQMLNWASDNISSQEAQLFDTVMNSGDPASAYFAIRALGQQWVEAKGYEGNLLQGKAPRNTTSKFRSQAELVEAMSDPRYENDDAYRTDVMAKLENSDLNF